MHRPLLLALAVLLAAPAVAAQSQPDDDPGTYVSLSDPRFNVGDAAFSNYGFRAEVGRRLGDGLEVGLIGRYERYSQSFSYWSAGTTAGLARHAPYGTVARLRGTALYRGISQFRRLGPDPATQAPKGALIGDLSATLSRTVPVVGSLRVEPTLGAYATVREALGGNLAPGSDVGLHLELPVRVRLLGADLSVVPAMRVSAVQAPTPQISDVLPTLGIRLDF